MHLSLSPSLKRFHSPKGEKKISAQKSVCAVFIWKEKQECLDRLPNSCRSIPEILDTQRFLSFFIIFSFLFPEMLGRKFRFRGPPHPSSRCHLMHFQRGAKRERRKYTRALVSPRFSLLFYLSLAVVFFAVFFLFF